jgi:hypothetical protein
MNRTVVVQTEHSISLNTCVFNALGWQNPRAKSKATCTACRLGPSNPRLSGVRSSSPAGKRGRQALARSEYRFPAIIDVHWPRPH